MALQLEVSAANAGCKCTDIFNNSRLNSKGKKTLVIPFVFVFIASFEALFIPFVPFSLVAIIRIRAASKTGRWLLCLACR
jgi:hypothetical protein